MTRERIGVLGGTFDPVHIAHLVAALAARHALGLDRVLLVVAGDPWQKRGTVVASSADRLAMTGAALDDLGGVEECGLEVSSIEVDRPGPTYTVDTLRALNHADRELFLIVGADVAARLDTWHEAETVRTLATIAVVARDGERGDARIDDALTVRMPRLEVASTDLRARVARGEPIDVLVPPGAVRVIRERHLYTRL